MTTPEAIREWNKFMDCVEWDLILSKLIKSSINDKQMRSVVLVLLIAEARNNKNFSTTSIRHPSCGFDCDHKYHLTWAYTDLPNITLSVEVRNSGSMEWFFRDRETGITDGTNDNERCSILPDKFWEYHDRFVSTTSR